MKSREDSLGKRSMSETEAVSVMLCNAVIGCYVAVVFPGFSRVFDNPGTFFIFITLKVTEKSLGPRKSLNSIWEAIASP